MNSAVGLDRLQFAFTVTFHYIFPQLTMGLALLIVVLKVLAVAKRNEMYSDAARFWMRIFAINFALLVVGLGWFLPGMALALGYSCFVYRHFSGKVV
jgi:cytochrome d ubiquinol oxidase subunit I